MKKLILIFIILFSSRVYAIDALVKGRLDCGSFLSGCDSSLLQIDCQSQTIWAEGVITGLNIANTALENRKSHVGKDVSSDTIKHAIIKYCRDNPLKDTMDATLDIYNQLLPKAPK